MCVTDIMILQNLVVADEEEFSAITDKIPQRPMTVVEGTSYSLVIIAALAVRCMMRDEMCRYMFGSNDDDSDYEDDNGKTITT